MCSLLKLDNEPDDDESDESGGVKNSALGFLLRQVFGNLTYKAIFVFRLAFNASSRDFLFAVFYFWSPRSAFFVVVRSTVDGET